MSAQRRASGAIVAALAGAVVAMTMGVGSAAASDPSGSPSPSSSPASSSPDCDSYGPGPLTGVPAAVLTGIHVTGGAGTITVSVDKIELAACFQTANLSVGLYDNGYPTVASVSVGDDGLVNWTSTFPAPAGMQKIIIGTTGTLANGAFAYLFNVSGPTEVAVGDARPGCSPAPSPFALSGLSLTSGPGTMTVTIKKYAMSSCFSGGTVVLSNSTPTFAPFVTLDMIAVDSDVPTGSYSRTFPVPAGPNRVQVSLVATMNGETQTTNVSPILSTAVPPAAPSVTATSTASATASPSSTATVAATTEPSKPANANTKQTSYASQISTTAIIGISVGAALLLAAALLIARRIRTRVR